MKNTLKFALTALLLAAAPIASADAVDCVKLSNAVKVAVAADSSRVLEIVASNVIVNAAILEAPSQIRIIAQCAIAAAPDAVSNVQAVLEQYDAAGGDGYSGKGGLDNSKDAKGATNPPAPSADGANPLDYPFESINDPIVKDNRFQPEFVFTPLEEDPGATDLRSSAVSLNSALR